MSIQSGYDKYKRYQKVDDDNYKLISHWTSSNTVHFDDDTTAEEKVAGINTSINGINDSISEINTSIDSIEEDLSDLNTEVENLKETTSTSSEDIATLESEKATRTELAETNENLTGLTDRFNYHEENSQKAELISYDNSISGLSANKVQGAIDSINAKADEAITVAKGKNRANVFDTTQDMQTWLSNVDNKEKCQVGDNLYIKAVDVPDWWVSEVLTEADPDTGYYYKVAQLETQKVDLGSLEDGLAEELAKLDDALIWQGQISGDDWATAQLGVWNTTTANETYNIPEYSVIYKPRPTSFLGAFLNCYSTGEQKGIYAWDASTSKFVRLPRINELDSKLSKSGGQITGKITTSVENVSYETNGNIYSPIYGGNLYDYLVIHNTAINNNQFNVNDLITRFPKTCCYVPNNDWNNAVENGFYMASGASNAPGTGWYMGIVIVHNANWVVQEVWEFTGGSDTLVCRKLVRHCREGKWTAWANPPVQFATKNAALYTDANGNVAASASVTATELGYLDGVTSSIQTQLNNRTTKENILAAGTNLNTVITSGFYRMNNNIVNAPTGADWSTMIVSRGGDTLFQLIVTIGGKMYTRSASGVGGANPTWNGWSQVGMMSVSGTTLNITL